MKIALAQFNTTVGDLAGNEAKILAAYKRGCEAGVELVVFPELTTTGYPPRDLLLKKDFVAQKSRSAEPPGRRHRRYRDARRLCRRTQRPTRPRPDQ